ncbi:MAG: DEAD/DEAH box helicase [Bacteroidia bacterium]|jgi:ATP-dependent RNA helicase DeaD|nr:DEAD/DEAH box helicase [Bacteroidia bacterium]
MSLFTELGLKPELAAAVAELGFTQPTPIQEQAIPLLLAAEADFIGLARTGTGKTAAFGLPLLHHIDLADRVPQSIVLCPTRELCLQITEDLKKFAVNLDGLRITAVYGGSSISVQIKELRYGTHIIVGTPGRVLDLIERGALKLGDVRFAVLDEADEMLDMGFRDDLDTILAETPAEKRTWLFSATMPSGVSRIVGRYMTNPQTVKVQGAQKGDGQINHFHCVVHARDRYAALRRLVDANPGVYGIVFCRTRVETQEVADHLIRDGYTADSLHGDLSQAQRDHVMKRFRGRALQLLVATDVAARGIDVDEITHVFHYQLPDEVESYTHRSGRTGRAGRSGASIVLLHMKEAGKLRQLERLMGKPIPHLNVPTAADVAAAQLKAFATRLRDTEVDENLIAEHLPVVLEELEGLSREELVSRIVGMQFSRLLQDYSKAPDLNAPVRGQKGERPEREERQQMEGEKHTFFFSLGRMDGIDPGEFLRILCDQLNVSRDHIGRIELKHNFSFVQTIALEPNSVVKAFDRYSYRGRKVRVNIAENKDDRSFGGDEERESKPRRKDFGSERPPRKDFGSERKSAYRKDGDDNRSSSFGDRKSSGSKSGFSKTSGGKTEKTWGKSWGDKKESKPPGKGFGASRPKDDDNSSGGDWRKLMDGGKTHGGKKSAGGKKKKW